MSAFSNMKISTKVFGGFGITLILLLVIAIVGYSGLINTGDNFTRYRALAVQTNEAGRVQANLLETRLQVKNFIINASEDNIKNVKERAQATLDLIEELKARVRGEPERLKIVEEKEIAMQQYLAAFDEVTKKQAEHNELYENYLNKLGYEMERGLYGVMESAYADGDAEAAYLAGTTLRLLMLGRLNVVKFLIENDQPSFDKAIADFNEMRESAKTLRNNLVNAERRALTDGVLGNLDTYQNAFVDIHKVILSRNDVIDKTLDIIGPQIASDIEDLKLAVKEEQDTLGPQATAAVKQATRTTLIVSIVGVGFAVLAAWLIGMGVSRPIRSMTEAMIDLAEGNKQTEIPSTDLKNEIGDMANAVLVFKENMIKADELAEQQRQDEIAKQKEAERVRKLIQEFELTVVQVLDNLSSADQSMTKIAGHVLDNATSTKERSTSVSAAAEQATQNVETVSSAAEELAASISEISRQVLQANSVSDKAVEESKHTSEEIRILEENVSKITEIVNLINDIADQTNLLALNATIEAARAGEAGKGFAVVASEVKNLANQTSKATEEIGAQIASVQNSTSQAVKAIDGISRVITEVSEISSSISAAVEEQSSATQEIARNVEEAATGTQSVSGSIVDVLHAAEESEHSANEISESSRLMSEESDRLREKVASFLQAVQGDDVSSAEILPWKDEYEFGVEVVDKEHKHLIEMINEVYRAIKANDADHLTGQVFDNLYNAFDKHFSSEQSYMEAKGYQGVDSHKKDHDAFLKRILELKADIEKGQVSEALKLLSALAKWWVNHHDGEDRKLADFAKRN